MSRPSDDMTLEELREEYDWLYEFNSRMAERIRENSDVHNHVDYVNRLEEENAKLREQLADAPKCEACEAMLDCDECLRADSSQKERKRLDYENAKLRELVRAMWLYDYAGKFSTAREDVEHVAMVYQRIRDLGIEVDVWA